MSFFAEAAAQQLPSRILALLNTSAEQMQLGKNASPRTVGDRTEEYLAKEFPTLLPGGLIHHYRADFARRAMEDFAFRDSQDNHYVVDVKTHCRSTKFNMPNLISVERLTRFYESPRNFFCICIVGYEAVDEAWGFTECVFVPIEELDWDCLTIGALGWGQIQIANARNIAIAQTSRRDWMLMLFERLARFYPREIEKLNKRMTYFEAARQRWQERGQA